MKRNILNTISSLFTPNQPKFFGFFTTLVFVFCIGFTTRTTAQCNYLYQGFEGFRTSVSAPGTAINPGLLAGYTNVMRAFAVGATSNSYGGTAALQLTGNTAYIITPVIASSTNEGNITLSFWARNSSVSQSAVLLVDSCPVGAIPGYPGSGNPASSTWTNILTATVTSTASTTPYVYYSVTFNPGPTGVYIRVRRNGAGSNSPIIDDLAWSSNVAAENTTIVMPNVNSPCYSTAARAISFSVDPLNTAAQPAGTVNSATDLASGVSYKLIDNGGDSDSSNTDNFNLNQDNTVVFTPASGDRIEFNNTKVLSGTVATIATGTLTLSGATTGSILPANSNIFPAVSYNGNFCENATLRYQTSTTGNTGVGLYTLVRSNPPSSCAAVTGLAVTTASITYNTVPLTWSQITGCSIPASGYDYFATTAASGLTPPVGANTVINTTTTQANNVASGSSTGVSITGLGGGTIYYIWVRTNCGGTSFGPWLQISNTLTENSILYTGAIKTVCGPQPLTYTENFQGSATLPACTSTAGSSSFSITTNAGNNYFSTNSVGISFYTQPVSLVAGTIYRLSYDYGNSANASSVFQIYYGSTNFIATAANITTSATTVTASSSAFTTGRYYFQPPSSGIYYIRFALNSNTGGVLNLDNIEIKEVPCYPAALPTVLSGAVNPCSSSLVTYTITANATGTSSAPDSYSFINPPAGWVVTGISGNTVTMLTGAIPGDITVISNLTGCDSSLPVKFPVSTSIPPGLPSAISGPTTVCTALPTANLTYSVTNVPGTTYNWSFPAGWDQTAGGTTNSVTFTASATAVSGTITVTPTNGGCNGTPRTLNVVVGTVANSVCTNAVTITSTATNTFRCATRHFWYQFSPPCNGDYKVNLSGTAGDIDVYVYSGAVYTCGGSNPTNLNTNLLISGISASSTESVNLSNLSTAITYYILVYDYSNGNGGTFNLSALSTTLSTIGTITGTSSVSCSSVTTTDYTVPVVTGATSYIWSLPAGWSGSSSTNTITVTTSGTTGGTISVVAAGACGTTVPATKLISVGQVQPDAIVGSTNLCSPFSATTYSVTPVIGATSYNWTLPPGWSGSSATNTIVVTPNSTSGSITVAASGPCGVSAATSLAVTTTAAVVTTNAAICAGDSGFLTSVVSGVTTFSMANIPVGTSNTFVRPNQANQGTPYSSSTTTVVYTTVSIVPSVTGSYTFNGCDSSGRDTFMTIYDTSFNPASPGTNFIASNDDSGSTATCNVDPRITLTMTAGQTYIIVYSGWFGVATIPSITGITVTVTPPSGGLVQLGSTEWYNIPSGGTPIYSGNSFNPVGAPGSGITDTLTPGVFTYYATNSQASFCRTPTTFTISAAPTQSITPVSGVICPDAVIAVNSNRTGSGVVTTWTSTLLGTLFTDALGTIPYTGTNLAVVYVKTTGTVTITAVSNVGSCSVTNNVTYTVSGYKTWDGGSWTPSGTPTINDALIIDGDYTTVSGETLLGCSCRVDSGNVVVVANSTISLTNDLNNSGGNILFENGAALLQTNNVANSGLITYTRNSTPCFKYDYTYWSSPVASQTLIGLSPQTVYNGFFDYNPAISNWQLADNTLPMTIGKGYLIRVPNYFPVSPASAINFTASFVGVPNNGTIPIPVAYNAANRLNLIGNPYPSPISASALVNDPGFSINGSYLGGTLYFWSHNTALNLVTNQFLSSDYAVWSVLGGVNTYYSGNIGTGNFNAPTGNIASGQGFFIRTIASGTAFFRNSMRLGAASNATFYRSNSSTNIATSNPTEVWEKHRIWLHINNSDRAFKQILVGYIQDGTEGLDRLFDGEMVDNNNRITFYTTVENTKLSIQGRGLTFTPADTFRLGYKSLAADNYSINLSDFDGLFTNQNIYLEDTLLNVIHNLKNSSYSFATGAGTFEDRFVLRFTTTALGVPTFSENTVVVYKDGEGLQINTGVIPMQSAVIYDVTGRLISSQKAINATQTTFTTLPTTQQVLLVQITAETGEKVTKKIVY